MTFCNGYPVLVRVDGYNRVGVIADSRSHRVAYQDRRHCVEVCWREHPVRYIIDTEKITVATVLDRIADAAVWGEPRLPILDGLEAGEHV